VPSDILYIPVKRRGHDVPRKIHHSIPREPAAMANKEQRKEKMNKPKLSAKEKEAKKQRKAAAKANK
jgi:hypothetical protein